MKNLGSSLLLVLGLTILAGCENNQSPDNYNTMLLIEKWVEGQYNNVAQFEADMAAGLPPEQTHRPMHQLFARVDAPRLEGHILFQQSSMDGSENPAMVFRHGLMQYLPVPDSNVVIQRELYFKDPEPYKNLHHNPEILESVTLDQMIWDEGCDFYLEANAAGDLVAGPLPGKCVQLNRGTGQEMFADDKVEITATDYRFQGRYRDAEGNILWGTASEELNNMTRQ